MNGPVRMFPARQIVKQNIEVQLPNCMYKIKSIHAPRNNKVVEQADHVSRPIKNLEITEQVKQFLKNNQCLAEMASLEARQQKILEQLADLKKQMLSLKADLKSTNNNVHKKTVAPSTFVCPLEVLKIPEIVVNASPSFLPYSLQIVQKLWGNSYWLTVKTYTHSSVSSVPPEAVEFASSLENFKPKNTGLQKVNTRLIWKEVGADAELVISRAVIIGEINILRYFSRISPDFLNYEKSAKIFEVDSILDSCYSLTRAKTKTERASLLQSINKSIGKSGWLCGGNSIGIADVGAYSAIKQVASNEVGVNMKKWIERCNSVV